MILAFIFLIALIVCVTNGEWGPAAVCAVVMLLSLFVRSSTTKSSRAYVNFRDYWAEGGPDRHD